MKRILMVASLLSALQLNAQDTLTLQQCYALAEQNYPLSRQADLLNSASELKRKNFGKNYLPQVMINANMSYQSDVTTVAIPFPAAIGSVEITELSKDWYKATLDVNQVIYDGNVTNYQKKLEKANLEADQKNLQVELYKLKDRVNQFFFSVVFYNENEKIIRSNVESLFSKLKEVRAAVAGGATIEMNADLLEAELIRMKQNLEELSADRSAVIKMLAELIGQPVKEHTKFLMPEFSVPAYTYENKRFENDLFKIQQNRSLLMRDMVTTKWNPKLSAFGQAGIGRPGLDMLSNSFDFIGIIGARFTWNFWSWNANKNEKQILELQSRIIKTQQDAFDKNLKIQAEKDLAEIMKISGLLSDDQKIISIREKITKTASSQLDNGVITSSDYIDRLNEETLARLNLSLHTIQLEKAKVTYLYNQGKLSQ